MKKIIYFNPSDYRILFLLEASIRAGYKPIYGYNFQEIWEADEIILLNIDPKKELEKQGIHPDLAICLKFKLINFQAWLDFPGDLDKNNLSVQNILRYFSPQMEIDSLDLKNSNRWIEKPNLSRYAKALHAAQVISNNKDDVTEYAELLISIAQSLIEQKNHVNIDTFCMQHQRVLDATDHCFGKINTKHNVLKLPGREIAYAYLDQVSDYLDLASLRKKCLQNFPFLTIIQYRQLGKEYNWFISKKELNVQTVFQLPASDNNYEILIEYPHNLMHQHLKKVIEGITRI